MPIYEYHCPTCGADFEKLMRMGADAPDCPECGSADVKKKVSRSGFVLKGGGWYKDHYGLKSGGSSSSSDSASATTDSSSSSSESSSSSTSSSDSSSGKSGGSSSDSSAAAK